MRYHIAASGHMLGSCISPRGLHQSDSLSPYLFIFCAEGLFVLIDDCKKRGLVHACKVGAPLVSHLFSADDSFFYFRAVE